MKSAIHDASARQHSGGPSPVAGRGGNRNRRARKPGLSKIEDEIAGLLDRPTPELRHAWREFHRAGPPLGLSRDLLIRALAHQLQEHAHTVRANRNRKFVDSPLEGAVYCELVSETGGFRGFASRLISG